MAHCKVRLTGLVVAGFLLAGCSLVGYKGELERSLEAWQQLKTEKGDYYRYEVNSGSALTPPVTTTLTVKNGSVVERSYVGTDYDENGNEVGETWTEAGSEVGSHEHGSEPLTLDARYSHCQNDVLSRNPIDTVILLEFMESGVLEYCAAFPKDVYYGGGFDGGGEYLRALEFLKD